MSEELDDCDVRIQNLEKLIRDGIKQISRLRGEKRDEKIQALNGLLRELKTVIRTYKVELRELSKEEKQPYEEAYKGHEETHTRLIQDLDWAKGDADRAALLRGGQLSNPQTRDQKLDKAVRIQKDDLKATERMLNQIGQTQEVAADTLEKMHSQTEQMARSSEGLSEQKELLAVGSKQLRAFARRIATDKMIMLFMCCIFLAIVVILVLALAAPQDTGLTAIQEQLPPGIADLITPTTAPPSPPTVPVPPPTAVLPPPTPAMA